MNSCIMIGRSFVVLVTVNHRLRLACLFKLGKEVLFKLGIELVAKFMIEYFWNEMYKKQWKNTYFKNRMGQKIFFEIDGYNHRFLVDQLMGVFCTRDQSLIACKSLELRVSWACICSRRLVHTWFLKVVWRKQRKDIHISKMKKKWWEPEHHSFDLPTILNRLRLLAISRLALDMSLIAKVIEYFWNGLYNKQWKNTYFKNRMEQKIFFEIDGCNHRFLVDQLVGVFCTRNRSLIIACKSLELIVEGLYTWFLRVVCGKKMEKTYIFQKWRGNGDNQNTIFLTCRH